VETAVDESFAELGSLVVELTVAVFEEVEAELKVFAVTLMVMTTVPPTLMEPSGHETVVVATVKLHVPCVVDDDEYATCAGITSVTVTP